MTTKHMEDNYGSLTIDLETNCKAPPPFSKASPHWPENKIVLAAWALGKDSPHIASKNMWGLSKFLIGHNIKFDLIHILKDRTYTAVPVDAFDRVQAVAFVECMVKNGVQVWDTQIAEYVLSGQTNRYASLNELADKYGLPLKDDKIKKYWDAGVDTVDIPHDELEEYAKHDVALTKQIADKQMIAAIERGMVPVILSSCAAVPALASVAHNGMHVDALEVASQKAEAEALLETYTEDIKATCAIAGIKLDNIDSNAQLKLVLFGGTRKEEVKTLVGSYKNGKPKYKMTAVTSTVKPLLYSSFFGDGTVSEDNLKRVANDCSMLGHTDESSFIKLVLARRKMKKLLGTYLDNLQTLVYPDGKIHGSIDQCGTTTGRFNSSSPNLQNYPSGDNDVVKRCFTSRFPGGHIVEADYKQLEVICLAHLSKDDQLCKDIRLGVDIHTMVGSKVFGISMTKEQRRIVKTVNFGLIYGGGKKTIASQSGQPEGVVENIIDAFYSRYPGVKMWQNTNIELVKKNAKPSGAVSKTGKPIRVSKLKAETGREHTFFEVDSPVWVKHGSTSFNPTEIKNYPVQGLATADIVPMMLGILWRKIYEDDELRDKCLIVNAVHDSFLFDVHPDVLVRAAVLIKEVMENAPKYYEETFGVPFELPLSIEMSAGSNWKAQHHIDIPSFP